MGFILTSGASASPIQGASGIILGRLLYRRGHRFEGGIHLPGPIGNVPILEPQILPTPPVLILPLQQPGCPAATPIVQTGRQVAAGERIARGDKDDILPIHAPLSGTVTAIGKVDTAPAADLPAIHLQTEASAEPPSHYRPQQLNDRSPPDRETLITAAKRAGIPTFSPSEMPLAAQMKAVQRNGFDTLLINTLDPEPMMQSCRSLLQHYLPAVITTAGLLHHAFKPRRTWLVLDRDNRQGMVAARAAVKGSAIRLADLPNRYPQHHPALLAAAITGRETPPGLCPEDIDVWVVQLPALLALAAALAGDETSGSLTHRLVTINGPVVGRPGLYWIPIGTRYRDILQHVQLKETAGAVIDGGLLTGRAVASLDGVMNLHTQALFVLSRKTHIPKPGPCIRCGWCQSDCPAGIDPQALLDLRERGRFDRAARQFAHACIECGICSYVCPTELPLTPAVIALKRSIEQMNQKTKPPKP